MSHTNSGLRAPILIIALVLAALIGGDLYITYGTVETVTITIKDEERIVTGSGKSTQSKYLVFTASETFENTDTLLHGKFNASDLQGALDRGQTYCVRVYGFRVPLLSWYRNIISIDH